jgi:hypothetical protein
MSLFVGNPTYVFTCHNWSVEQNLEHLWLSTGAWYQFQWKWDSPKPSEWGITFYRIVASVPSPLFYKAQRCMHACIRRGCWLQRPVLWGSRQRSTHRRGRPHLSCKLDSRGLDPSNPARGRLVGLMHFARSHVHISVGPCIWKMFPLCIDHSSSHAHVYRVGQNHVHTHTPYMTVYKENLLQKIPYRHRRNTYVCIVMANPTRVRTHVRKKHCQLSMLRFSLQLHTMQLAKAGVEPLKTRQPALRSSFLCA